MEGHAPAENIWRTLGIGKTKYYKTLKELNLSHSKDDKGKLWIDNDSLELIENYLKGEDVSVNNDDEGTSGELVKTEAQTPANIPETDADFIPENEDNIDQQKIIDKAMSIRTQREIMPDLIALSLAEKMTLDDLTPDYLEAINKTKEAVNPKDKAESIAESLFSQWRSKKQ